MVPICTLFIPILSTQKVIILDNFCVLQLPPPYNYIQIFVRLSHNFIGYRSLTHTLRPKLLLQHNSFSWQGLTADMSYAYRNCYWLLAIFRMSLSMICNLQGKQEEKHFGIFGLFCTLSREQSRSTRYYNEHQTYTISEYHPTKQNKRFYDVMCVIHNKNYAPYTVSKIAIS